MNLRIRLGYHRLQSFCNGVLANLAISAMSRLTHPLRLSILPKNLSGYVRLTQAPVVSAQKVLPFSLLWGDVAGLRISDSEIEAMDVPASIAEEESSSVKIHSLLAVTRIRARMQKAFSADNLGWCNASRPKAKTASRVYDKLSIAFRSVGGSRAILEEVLKHGRSITAVASKMRAKSHGGMSSIIYDFADTILMDNPFGLSYKDNVKFSLHILIFGEIEHVMGYLKVNHHDEYTLLTAALSGGVEGESIEAYIVERASKACIKGNEKYIDANLFDSRCLRVAQRKIQALLPSWIASARTYYTEQILPSSSIIHLDMPHLGEHDYVEDVLRAHGVPEEYRSRELISDIINAATSNPPINNTKEASDANSQRHQAEDCAASSEEPLNDALVGNARDMIIRYFDQNEDKWIYPEEVAEAVGIDFFIAQSICEELLINGKLKTTDATSSSASDNSSFEISGGGNTGN